MGIHQKKFYNIYKGLNRRCVYKIYMKSEPNKVYVGSTKHFTTRKNSHITRLEKGDHDNKNLQNLYSIYDTSSLIIEPCVTVPLKGKLRDIERLVAISHVLEFGRLVTFRNKRLPRQL